MNYRGEKYDSSLSLKEIAKLIRQDLRRELPNCKFSVRVDGWHSIYIRVKSTPYEYKSDEYWNIVNKVYEIEKMYNYDNSDILTDYWDYRFACVCQGDMDYKQIK